MEGGDTKVSAEIIEDGKEFFFLFNIDFWHLDVVFGNLELAIIM